MFEPERDLYVCPRGNLLKTTGRVHDARTLLYRADPPPRTIPRFKLDLTPPEGRADTAVAPRSGGRIGPSRLPRAWCRESVGKAAMRSDRVVMVSPAFDEHLRLLQRAENFSIEQFVPEFPIE